MGFFISADRTPSEIKHLHGWRGRKHRILAHHQSFSQPVSEGLHNQVSALGDDSGAWDESLPYGVCRVGTVSLFLPGIRVIRAITLGEPMFRNKQYAGQLKDFSGLRWGAISPTDIDGLLEFSNRLFIFVETKYKNAPVPTGQRLALERMADCVHRCEKAAIIVVTSHESDGDIDMGLTTVRQYRENGTWHHDVPEIGLRDFVDLMRRKYLG